MTITFCIIDDIDSYANSEIKNTIRNICDFTISNLYTKGYRSVIGKDEDYLLKNVDTDYAVVMSPGTEYINGAAFFNELEKLITRDFFLAGHILDRTMHDAYYELHCQCYVINIKYYKSLGQPNVGTFEKYSPHTQIEPFRSKANWHDDYTPTVVTQGFQERTYKHKCHGWNLLRLAFDHSLPVLVFDEGIRYNKKHYYPESEKDYYKNVEYIQHKLDYCANEFVHTSNTEYMTSEIKKQYNQIVIPASGTHYLNLIENGRVIFYDYNQRALNFWKKNILRKSDIEYVFVHTNLLEETSIIEYLNSDLSTLVNLSNVFCYEGTAAKYSLRHRLLAQENLLHLLRTKVKNIDINFSLRADAGH